MLMPWLSWSNNNLEATSERCCPRAHNRETVTLITSSARSDLRIQEAHVGEIWSVKLWAPRLSALASRFGSSQPDPILARIERHA